MDLRLARHPRFLMLAGALLMAAAGCSKEPAVGNGSPDAQGRVDVSFPTGDGSSNTGDGNSSSSDGAPIGGDSGTSTLDDGAIAGGDGSSTLDDGAIAGGDGSSTLDDGAIAGGDGSSTLDDGAIAGGDGSSTLDDGAISGSDGGGSAGADGATGGTDAGGSVGSDGATGATDSGGTAGSDGAAAGADGGGTSGTDGATGGADGGGTNSDAGSVDGGSLGQPQSEFCRGTGAVVEVGGGGQCSGDIAQQTFRFALCTCQQLTVQSNLEVDAFDSRRGPYAGTTTTGVNIRDDGHIGVNGQLGIDGMLTVLGSTFVSGGGYSVGQQSSVSLNVYANGDAVQVNSESSIGRNAYFNGDVVGRFDIAGDLHVPSGASVSAATQSNLGGSLIRGPIPTIEPCPCGANQILDIQSLVDWGQQFNDNATVPIDPRLWENGTGPDVIELPCGRYYLTRIIHPRGITIRALGRTVLYVDGDVILGGGLRLEVAQGAEIDSFIAGSVSLQAASRLGSADTPSAVRTYIGGIGDILLDASTLFGGNLYAPRADVYFGASANLYGALFARNAIFSGSAEVHFDSAIRSAGQQCDPPPPDGGVSDGGGGDAGVVDSGTGSPDASPPDSGTCTGCFQCGNSQACLLPPDGGVGSCGACQSDLDCCPPDICVNGSCFSSF